MGMTQKPSVLGSLSLSLSRELVTTRVSRLEAWVTFKVVHNVRSRDNWHYRMTSLTTIPLLCVICLVIFELVLADGEMGLGMDCESSSDCKMYAYCGPGRVCTCREKYVPDRDNTTCLAGVGQRCEYDDSCVPHAFCRHQERCECKRGFLQSADLLHCTSGAAGLGVAFTAAMARTLLFH